MMISWQNRPLADFVTSRPGNNKIIKGKQSSQPGHGLFQGFSASGPDVWVSFADYHQPGVVISAVGARCGKTFPADGDWTAIANTHVLLPGNDIHPRWLWYRTNDEDFWIKGGAAQPFVKVKDTLQQAIPIPPLLEQRRIVRVLDEAFEGLAIAKANAEKNLQNARALFESHLQSVFTHRGPGWVETAIGASFDTSTGTTPSKANPSYYGDFIPFVKPPELCDGPLDSAEDNLSRAGAEVARTLPSKSILVSCIGNLGKIGLNTLPVAFNQQINAILPNPSKAMPEIIFFQALSSSFKEQLERMAGGTTVSIVNKSKFNSVRIVIPPLSEQPAIVTQLNALSEETQRLTRIYGQKLAALEALKKSLLHQAFSGNL